MLFGGEVWKGKLVYAGGQRQCRWPLLTFGLYSITILLAVTSFPLQPFTAVPAAKSTTVSVYTYFSSSVPLYFCIARRPVLLYTHLHTIGLSFWDDDYDKSQYGTDGTRTFPRYDISPYGLFPLSQKQTFSHSRTGQFPATLLAR